jgi:hypothetical protein
VLVVHISLWPDGDATEARTIARSAIANVTDDDAARGADYVVYTEREAELPDAFLIQGHAREAGVWELLRRVAEARAPNSAEHVPLPPELRSVAHALADKLDEDLPGR